MKFIRISAAVLLLAVMACSCDFVRATLGKPTSQDIQAIRDRLALEEQARQDSILEAQILLEAQQAELQRQEALRLRRFNVSAGTFKDSLNAEKLCATICDSGYEASVYRYVTGERFAVLLGGYDAKEQAIARLDELTADEKFTFDICVFDAQNELEKIQNQTISQ